VKVGVPKGPVSQYNDCMKLFKRQEIFGVGIILVVIVVVTYINILVSLRNERDLIRNLDVSAIAKGVKQYRADYGFYPASQDGTILACSGKDTRIVKDEFGRVVFFNKKAKKPLLENLVACKWGEDALLDINDIEYPNYLSSIPKDPRQEDGYSYFYLSNGQKFQILGAFEGKSQKEYSKEIKALKISCGSKVCNFGKTNMGTGIKEVLQ